MTVGIVGLGLIGGSFAKAYKKANCTVLSYDIDSKMLGFALLDGSVDSELSQDNIGKCDLILLCLYPDAAVDYISRLAPYISKDSYVIDCCGTKEKVCAACFNIAKEVRLLRRITSIRPVQWRLPRKPLGKTTMKMGKNLG